MASRVETRSAQQKRRGDGLRATGRVGDPLQKL